MNLLFVAPRVCRNITVGLVAVACCSAIPDAAGAAYTIHDTAHQTSDSATIEIRGVGAGQFNPDYWLKTPPNLVRDVRHPLMEPKAGRFRNIYAPSAVARPEKGWYVYYGGWDGIEEGHDAIYVTTTKDFGTFGERKTVVAPGPFQHVCNVNAQFAAAGGGAMTLMCTVYPDSDGKNKPGMFHLPLSVSETPLIAAPSAIVEVHGYENYPDADINGMNVLLQNGDRSLLYFGDFSNFGHVYVASGDAGSTSTFHLEGVSLDGKLAVNDVKILRDTEGKKWYLMGLHMNHDSLYYSLSQDPLRFSTAKKLLHSASDADKFIVALGWVTDGSTSLGGTQIAGLLYGAGGSHSLDTNRIFARWLQKRLEFVSGETTGTDEPPPPQLAGAMGPSTVVLSCASDSWSGDILIADEGGKSEGLVRGVTLEAGHVYELRAKETPRGPKPQKTSLKDAAANSH